ncbi:retrovirus-related pol polyprotein from transposon TNT 1-94 [Tanacetum coccineum]
MLNNETMRIEESLNVTFDESLSEPKSSLSVKDDRINESIVQDLNGSLSLQINVLDEGYPKSLKEDRGHPIEQAIGELNERTLRTYVKGLEVKQHNIMDEVDTEDLTIEQYLRLTLESQTPKKIKDMIIAEYLQYEKKVNENHIGNTKSYLPTYFGKSTPTYDPVWEFAHYFDPNQPDAESDYDSEDMEEEVEHMTNNEVFMSEQEESNHGYTKNIQHFEEKDDVDEWLNAEKTKHMSMQGVENIKDALISIIKSIRQEMKDGIMKRKFEASTTSVSDEVSSIASNEVDRACDNTPNTAPCRLPKELSPRSFLLPFNINSHNLYATTTLDAKDNIMPQGVYEYLGLDKLKNTSTLENTTGTNKPLGTVNILVKFRELEFPCNFVIKIAEDVIILGRPFLESTRAQIDVFNEENSFEIGSKKFKFNIDSHQSIKKIYMVDIGQEEETFNPLEIGIDLFSYESPSCLEFEQRTRSYGTPNPHDEIAEPISFSPDRRGLCRDLELLHLVLLIGINKWYQSLCSETLIKKLQTRRTLYSIKDMDLETTQNNVVAKLPLLKQGDYEMWKLRIEQYFQVQDYALWEVIEYGSSFRRRLVMILCSASATHEVSIAAANLVYIRRSVENRKDKGKAIMIEDESVQKKSKKQLEQERLSHEEAIKLQEQIDEEERKRIARDVEIAKQLQEEYDKARKKKAIVEVDTAHVIDWNDPSVIRYHALQNRPRSVAEVRKNMLMYLKNQGGYKMKDFKGMRYDDIRPIFKKVWDQVHSFVPMDSEEEQTDEEPKTDELSQEQLNQMSRQSHRVHHVSTEKGQDIFMLVEKDYPLTKGLATLMLCNKLRVDQQSEIADELLIKIYNIANRPRK